MKQWQDLLTGEMTIRLVDYATASHYFKFKRTHWLSGVSTNTMVMHLPIVLTYLSLKSTIIKHFCKTQVNKQLSHII